MIEAGQIESKNFGRQLQSLSGRFGRRSRADQGGGMTVKEDTLYHAAIVNNCLHFSAMLEDESMLNDCWQES